MFKHHTKNKGDLGVAKAIADLTEQEFVILNPLTEHAPFDLVVYRDKKFYRVQVKYREANKSGGVEVRLSSNWVDKHGNHSKKIDKDEVDVICVYCPQTNLCYYFDPAVYTATFTFRLTPAKNKQVKGIIDGNKYLKMQA